MLGIGLLLLVVCLVISQFTCMTVSGDAKGQYQPVPDISS